MAGGCLPCANWDRLGELPPAEAIVVGPHWRVAHAFNSTLRGWLVVVPRRHVTALDQLDAFEMAELGPLLGSVTAALRAVVGCTKTYVMLFAEQVGFGHVHFHVVPRMADLPENLRGPAIFHHLSQPESAWIGQGERDALALSLREALSSSEQRGRAVFLVGPSSAGKTSIGRALIELLPEGYLFYESDRFGLSGPKNRPELVTLERERLLTRATAMAVRAYLDAGVNLVVERSFWDAPTRRPVAAVFAPYDAWLVGLTWQLPELERRERRRTDGVRAGTAADQASRPHHWDGPYDLTVDAVSDPPEVSARRIAEWLRTDPAPQALRELAGRLRATPPGGTPPAAR